jgi:DNA-binding HxlR family transcriptional regulator
VRLGRRKNPPNVPERQDGPVHEAEPLERAVASVGDRWTLLVVHALLDGPLRFTELGDAVPGVAPNILTRRLRHLEHEGLVLATPYSRRPLRVTYELTVTGRRGGRPSPRRLWHVARGPLVVPHLRPGGGRRRGRRAPPRVKW